MIDYIKVTATASDENTRVRRYILDNYRTVVKSKESLHRSFGRNEIIVNGQSVEETRLLKENDVLEIKFDNTFDENKMIQSVPVRICYQDEYLAIIWKPSGQNFTIFEKAIQEKISLKNESGEQTKAWCINDIQKAASGLILVAKTEEINEKLTKMYSNNEIQVTMRVICHGFVPTTDMNTLFTPEINKKDEESEPIVPGKIIKSINLVSQTRSNNSLFISTLDLDLVTPLFNGSLRRLFYFHSKHPIIGNSTFTKPLRVNSDKGLCASIIGISLRHPITEAQIQIQENEPDKFKVMRDREERFYQRKLKQESEEIAKATAIDLSERKDGQLLAYLLGQKDFCGLTYKITSDCLIPRTSSETLVHAATEFLSKCTSPRVVDVGTGCGNLLISILSNVTEASGVGIDISQAALQVAKTNSETHQVIDRAAWRLQDMATLDQSDEKYHVLVCNPPYLDLQKTSKKKSQMACLSQEPAQALFANDEGYEFYNILSRVAHFIVEHDGRVILECGKGMMARVLDIWSGHWEPETIIKDIQRWDRCVVLKRKQVNVLSQL